MMMKADADLSSPLSSQERISYVRHMLGELTHVARAENAELLVYLLEMAFTEASDLLSEASRAASKIERDKPAGVAMKPAGKI